MSTTVRLNEAKNGIEIKFDAKPPRTVLDSLKSHNFRWSKYQKLWYAKQTSLRLSFANSLASLTPSEESYHDMIENKFSSYRG